MTKEAKFIEGHAMGTRMKWLCVRHKQEGVGFGNQPAIICVDMTVHAPELNKPNVVMSIYEGKTSDRALKRSFQPNAYSSPEQIGMAKHIVENWEDLKSGDKVEIEPVFDD